MRSLLLAAALMAAAVPAHAKVILNNFDEDGSAKARQAMREDAIARGEEIPLEAHEYRPPSNAFSAGWAAAHARVKQAFAGTEQSLQENKVANARKDLARAKRRGDDTAVSAAMAKLQTEEAKLAEISAVTANHRASATEHWDSAKGFTHAAMKGDGKHHVAGFEDEDR